MQSSFLITGRIVRGKGRGGSQLGFPTANLDLGTGGHATLATLEDGVYACWAALLDAGEILPAVASLGTNPHFDDLGLPAGARLLEVHLMRLLPDLYDRTLRVALVLPRLRAMARFPTTEALVQAIRDDVDDARRLLAESPVAQQARRAMQPPLALADDEDKEENLSMDAELADGLLPDEEDEEESEFARVLTELVAQLHKRPDKVKGIARSVQLMVAPGGAYLEHLRPAQRLAKAAQVRQAAAQGPVALGALLAQWAHV